MNNQEAYQQAKKRLQLKASFKVHLAVYFAVITLLFVINLNTSTEYLWAKWPMMGWGIGLLAHGLSAYVFTGNSGITDEMIKREMEKTGNS